MRLRAMTLVAILVLSLRGATAAAQQPLAQPVATPPAAQHLSLQDAETRALENNPRVRSGRYQAQAADETVREFRSAYFPAALGSVTGAESLEGTRIAAGGLNNPTVLDRFAYGVAGTQLVTDFGRTPDLVASARYGAQSAEQQAANLRATVLLDVDRAYLDVLRATAVRQIAQQTVAARQVVVDQVTALMNGGLRSSLDVSFARVSLGEAQLLQVQAQNDLQASFARLSAVLGNPRSSTYALDDQPMPGGTPDSAEPLIAQALRDRPDVARERFAEQSLTKLADAERALSLPSVALVGAAGMTPFHETGFNDHYAAAGVNVSVPVFNGGLFAARRTVANFRAMAQQQLVQDMENSVARDVQVAWLDARTAQQRLTLTADILAEASDAVMLAQQRYNLGLSSIVELTQAQLNKTEADIEVARSRYEYQIRSVALRFQTGALK
jgi:outer membrane protein